MAPPTHHATFLSRPALLSRHLTLVSQTHSLTQFLSLANPNTLNAQLARREEILLQDARQHNKFSEEGADDRNGDQGFGGETGLGDALFGGRPADPLGEGTVRRSGRIQMPKLTYSDGDANPLARTAPHPFYPLDADKAQTVIPSLLLPRGLDAQVAQDAEARWEQWLATYAGVADPTPGSKEMLAISVETKRQWIQQLRGQMRRYDTFASEALRSWVHAREAADELGQRYDWRMRLAPDEESEEEDEGGPSGGVEEPRTVAVDEEGDHEMKEDKERKRKREGEEDTEGNGRPLSLGLVRSLLRTGQA